MKFDVKVTTSGPFFEPGVPGRIMSRYCRTVEDRIGDEGVTLIRAFLPTQYMYLGHSGGDPKHNPIPHDAGRYESEIQTERQTEDHLLITDGGRIVYGPWLEGVSLRNFNYWPGRARRGLPPRFPGYHAFRRISQKLDLMATDLAEEELPPYLEELNGL